MLRGGPCQAQDNRSCRVRATRPVGSRRSHERGRCVALARIPERLGLGEHGRGRERRVHRDLDSIDRTHATRRTLGDVAKYREAK